MPGHYLNVRGSAEEHCEIGVLLFDPCRLLQALSVPVLCRFSRNPDAIMGRRRDPSTALPAPFLAALVPCWPFPDGDGITSFRLPSKCPRHEKRGAERGTDNAE